MSDTLFEKIAAIARPKFCGDTSIILNARVKIAGITGEDKDLNGLKGSTTHPFPFGYDRTGMIGIYLDAGQKNSREGNRVNVHAQNVIFIDD